MPRTKKVKVFVSTNHNFQQRELTVVENGENNIINRIKIQSLYPAHLKYTGRVSGELYSWHKAGDVVEVQEEDVATLLAIKLGSSSCCGLSGDGNVIFQTVQ